MDEFSEKLWKGGGGSFQIQKNHCRYKWKFWLWIFGKFTTFFPGRVKGRLGFLRKFIHFDMLTLSASLRHNFVLTIFDSRALCYLCGEEDEDSGCWEDPCWLAREFLSRLFMTYAEYQYAICITMGGGLAKWPKFNLLLWLPYDKCLVMGVKVLGTDPKKSYSSRHLLEPYNFIHASSSRPKKS